MDNWTRDDFQRLADLCSVMAEWRDTSGAVSPLASFFARGQQAIQFSTALLQINPSAFVPITALESPVSDSDCTPLLTLNTKSGAPRTWHVKAMVQLQGQGSFDFTIAQVRLRVRWTVGALTTFADVDFRAASLAFPVTCDSIELMAYARVTGGFVNLPAPQVSVAVSPFPLAGDYRAPTLTRYASVPGIAGPPILVPIPRHAQRMTVIAPGPLPFQYWDSSATVLAQMQQASPLGIAQDMPGGAATVAIIGPPSPLSFNPVALVFELGF